MLMQTWRNGEERDAEGGFTWTWDVGQGWNGGSGLGFDHVRQ